LLVMSKQQQAPGELELVRAFVNTLDIERDEELLTDPPGLGAWLHEHGLAPEEARPSAPELKRARELREALRAVLFAHNEAVPAPATALSALDAIAARADVRLRFRESGAAELAPEQDGVDGALGRLLAIVHSAIGQGTWSRLKACRETSCQWAFYDRTKNRSGTWCKMEVCGNRAKARAYRQRHVTRDDS
jgi:predicted RNA-binding Zn ribbon-like protein